MRLKRWLKKVGVTKGDQKQAPTTTGVRTLMIAERWMLNQRPTLKVAKTLPPIPSVPLMKCGVRAWRSRRAAPMAPLGKSPKRAHSSAKLGPARVLARLAQPSVLAWMFRAATPKVSGPRQSPAPSLATRVRVQECARQIPRSAKASRPRLATPSANGRIWRLAPSFAQPVTAYPAVPQGKLCATAWSFKPVPLGTSGKSPKPAPSCARSDLVPASAPQEPPSAVGTRFKSAQASASGTQGPIARLPVSVELASPAPQEAQGVQETPWRPATRRAPG
jgi:hypothetical protein